MSKTNIKRILAIDLMRAFAVFMMVQGHTVHSLLSVSSIDTSSYFYQIWLFFRAFTAPLFIFSAGLVFTYILFQKEIDFKNNPRILKGIYRGVSLYLIGYLLRFPTIQIFNLDDVTHYQWLTFFSVDALHLIGIGLLLIVLISIVSSKLKINPIYIFVSLVVIIFAGSPFLRFLNWEHNVNIFVASYFTIKYGSIFPIFPYLEFVFFGAIFGVLITQKHEIITKKSYLISYLVAGAVLLFLAYLTFSYRDYSDSLLRFGALFTFLSIFSFIGARITKLPKIVASFARNSLWIYIIHLIILYGSPTSVGITQILNVTLSPELTILSAIFMVSLMTLISLGIDKFRTQKFNFFRKNLGLE